MPPECPRCGGYMSNSQHECRTLQCAAMAGVWACDGETVLTKVHAPDGVPVRVPLCNVHAGR